MSLRYIIDGCNVINHRLFRPRNKTAGDKRGELAGFIRLGGLCGSPSNHATIVFDGFPSDRCAASKVKGIDILFSGNDSADNLIKKLVEKSSSLKNIKVVSDDKEVALFARLSGASAVKVDEFISRGKKQAVKTACRFLPEQKVELSQSQIYSINSELERLWLK